MAINDIAAGDLVTFIKWNDTTRDQTRNISHSELLKYVLFVKFTMNVFKLNFVKEISKFNLFHLNIITSL